MSGVRVIVSIQMDSAKTVDVTMDQRIEQSKRVESTEEGCLQYEVYRSVTRPERIVLLEHWSTYELYDKHWTEQLARGGRPRPRPGSTSTVEFYRHELYQLVDGIWVPSEPRHRTQTIQWSP